MWCLCRTETTISLKSFSCRRLRVELPAMFIDLSSFAKIIVALQATPEQTTKISGSSKLHSSEYFILILGFTVTEVTLRHYKPSATEIDQSGQKLWMVKNLCTHSLSYQKIHRYCIISNVRSKFLSKDRQGTSMSICMICTSSRIFCLVIIANLHETH